MKKKAELSVASQILLALVPYSRSNLQLAFRPSQFFDELERNSGISRGSLQQSYTRLKKRGLISDARTPSLTARGKQQIQPLVAEPLADGRQLMVIFDIPEDIAEHRRQLRNLLKYLGFTQIQRSVWVSSHDHIEVLRDAIDDLRIAGWVEVYTVSKIK